MEPDPTAEIKRIRHELGAADGYDLDRIFARARRLEESIDPRLIRQPPEAAGVPAAGESTSEDSDGDR